MNMRKQMKLWNYAEPGKDLHNTIVHAYYHLQHAERAYRMARAGQLIYGENPTSDKWMEIHEEHFLAYWLLLQEIPQFESYLDYRAHINIERRMEKTFVEEGDKKPAFREAEARRKRRERKSKARYN